MRIAVFNASRRLIGGVEKYLSHLIPELLRLGHEISLLHEVDTPIDRKPLYDGQTWCIADLGQAIALEKVRAWNPDLIFVNSFLEPNLITPVINATPTVFFCHDYVGTCISGTKMVQFPVSKPCSRQFGPVCLLEYYPRHCGGWHPLTMWNEFQRQSNRLSVLRKGSLLLTASRAMRDEYMRHGFAPNYIQHIPYVIDISESESKCALAEPWRLLFLGRMETLKGGALLIEALPKAAARLGRRLRLVFAGDGRARNDWERMGRRQMLKFDSVEIDFQGWLDGEALGRLFLNTDLVVMPSVWPEPFGCSGLEPGQFQIPAVAFDVGGVSDWLREGVNGHLANGKPPIASGLVDAIVRCLQDPSAYERLCRGAGEVARSFNMRTHINQLLQIFEYAVSANQIHENAV